MSLHFGVKQAYYFAWLRGINGTDYRCMALLNAQQVRILELRGF
jgi:hypothetical protein